MSTVPAPMFTFTQSTATPRERIRCHHCGWEAKGRIGRVWGREATHVCRVACDSCGREARRPSIDIGLRVFCTRCCTRAGMFPGECGEIHTEAEWRRLAAIAQTGTSTPTDESAQINQTEERA